MRVIGIVALAAMSFVLTACSTLDLSDSSCGAAEGRCLKQCRDAGGAGQMVCEDACRADADACYGR